MWTDHTFRGETERFEDVLVELFHPNPKENNTRDEQIHSLPQQVFHSTAEVRYVIVTE